MTMEGDTFAKLGSVIASVMFVSAIVQRFFPFDTRFLFGKYHRKVFTSFYPYIQIKFNESTGDRFRRSEAYSTIETYLGSISTMQVKRLKGDIIRNNTQTVSLSMDDHEEVADDFNGVKVYWASGKYAVRTDSISLHQTTDERRYYKLTFHKKYREIIIGEYLNHVLKKGNEIKVKNRLRKLYTNSGSRWTQVTFEHPATFQTLAMDAEKKQEIMDDLIAFSKAEEFYKRIGKAWKRGYLLYGPPGTGKSTMIAAMANFLGYDIYDLELTNVSDNTELRRLLIETSSKSIIVIEDIDCSVDLTKQRKNDKKKEEEGDSAKKTTSRDQDSKTSRVTLSGLLNFIDGLWSACKGERLVVFTTNHVDKLDSALIRRGRMDKHIELGYCSFEAFKVLAKNYLYLGSHTLFDKIRVMLEETNMTPADVAENLMPKTSPGDPEGCLKCLMEALEKAKQKKSKEASNEDDRVMKEVENGIYVSV